METERPFKAGYLLFPPQGVLGQLKKSWHKKYCQLFKSSKHGIERLEVFDSEEDVWKNSNVRIITLENCIKITQDAQKHHPNVFAILTKTCIYHFASLTERELAEWIIAFQSIAFKDDCSKQTIEEDNDLYCSSGEGVFTVKLVPSEASIRCGLESGSYTLVVASAAIQLRDCHDHHLLFTWPYRYIRRYGYREGKFIFEAGRKCDTGEGTFHLEHSNQQEIFRCLSSKMKSMRKLLSGESSSSPAIVCGDIQFQAALSMEARSRSPLPPSPSSATPILDLDYNIISQSSVKPLISPIIETKPLIISKIPPPTKPKPKPRKPPRKHILSSSQINAEDSVEPVGFGRYKKLSNSDMSPSLSATSSVAPIVSKTNYDKVEVRKDAWRTLGVDEINHTERLFRESDTEEDPLAYVEVQGAIQQEENNVNPTKVQCSKILLTQLSNKPESVQNYDTLQHFGSSSKLNSKPGYRHIPATGAAVPTPTQSTEPPSITEQYHAWNEYDMVMENMKACRLADDSHYGYGMIRKKSTPNDNDVQDDVGPNHQVYNELEYAVVQKPKRV